jgi:hypothetical protein
MIKDVFTADLVARVRGTPSVSMSVTMSVYGTKTRQWKGVDMKLRRPCRYSIFIEGQHTAPSFYSLTPYGGGTRD